jgi:Tfp pilus assembly protein PilV
VTPTPGRSGHSLAELLVALTFLGATLAALASSTVLATRWTTDAVLRQRAVALTEAVLDSLVFLDHPPGPGSREERDPPWAIRWSVESAGAGGPGSMDGGGSTTATVRVTVSLTGQVTPSAELSGLWIPPRPPGDLLPTSQEGGP